MAGRRPLFCYTGRLLLALGACTAVGALVFLTPFLLVLAALFAGVGALHLHLGARAMATGPLDPMDAEALIRAQHEMIAAVRQAEAGRPEPEGGADRR